MPRIFSFAHIFSRQIPRHFKLSNLSPPLNIFPFYPSFLRFFFPPSLALSPFLFFSFLLSSCLWPPSHWFSLSVPLPPPASCHLRFQSLVKIWRPKKGVFFVFFSSRDKEDKLKSFEEKFSPGEQHMIFLRSVSNLLLKIPCVCSLWASEEVPWHFWCRVCCSSSSNYSACLGVRLYWRPNLVIVFLVWGATPFLLFDERFIVLNS